MKSHFLRRAVALLLTLALACSLLAIPAAADDIPVIRVDLDRDQLTLEKGSSELLYAEVIPDDATNKTLEWSSSDERVATVDQTGRVSAVGPGSATITVTTEDGGRTDSCRVTVTVSATRVLLEESRIRMTVGEERALPGVVLSPSDATDPVIWDNPNSDIVQISGGRLIAKAAGTAVLTANAGNARPDTCTVTVEEASVTSITVTPDSASVSPGETISLTAKIEPANVENKTIIWDCTQSGVRVSPSTSTSGSSVTLTVSETVTPGTTFNVIASSAASPGHSTPCVIRVAEPQPPQVSSVQINVPATDYGNFVDPSKTLECKATAYPLDAPEEARKITWTSKPTAIATVNAETGVVTGIAPGKATIRASAGEKYDEREIEVSGILLSYIKKSPSGGQGTSVSLNEDSPPVEIYQYRDISVTYEAFGNAFGKVVNWESTNNSVAQVINGRVTGNYPGEAIIKAVVAGTGFSASFKVKVSEDVAQAITVNMGSEPSYPFSDLMNELNRRSQDKAGAPLESVYNLKVSTKNGVLYYKYSTPDTPGHGVGGTERFYYQPSGQGQMALRDVTFVPLPGFEGTAVVDYNAAATTGTTFTGTIRIEATATGDVNYSTAIDRPVSFAAEHFSSICLGRTGRAIRYVTFGLPSSSRGTLYYNYSPTGLYSPKVDSDTRYYATSSPSIDGITFVPAKGFTGDVDIPYRCTDSSGASYSGTVTVRVQGTNGEGSGDVEYSTGRNQRRSLSASDFNDACQRATNSNLNYIRFTSLPSSSAGILYYNYVSSSSARVDTGRNYYRSSTPRISNITFVPAKDYRGTITIPFTGTSTTGATFSGDLILHVDDGVGTVHYDTPKNQPITFASGDFNDASRRITGRALNYARFTSLPSSSTGILYYNYTSSSSSRVSTSTDYRRSGSPSLSNITFVPASGYTGTVSIPFYGYDESGVRFDGTVTVTVGGGSGRTISYSVATNSSVRLNASDFNSACRSATGDGLNYVRFDLPSSQYGTLYHQYNSSSRTGNTVSSGTGYYYSGSNRLLGDVSFVSTATPGTSTFGYTGYSTRGDSFSGTVEVTISGPSTVNTSIRYSGSSAAPISLQAVNFQNACQAALGNQLAYVQFNSLPSVGHLYQNYSGPARTGTGVSAITRYNTQELNQISYLPKAEYQGTIVIPYTAFDTRGASHSSTVEIQLSNAYCSATFTDTARGWDWAKPSIEFLRGSGITNGYGNNTYRPGQSISRGEFTLMICRAFQFPMGGSSGFPDVPANSTYAGAVATARDLGIVQGNNGRFQPDRPITRQSAMAMICRAMEAAGQSLPATDSSLLSSYTDGYQVSAFARPSVAALVQMGAVRGNSASRLNPGAAISRAEMAVILHRVLTR
ncbi:MAG: hypothetical protein HFG05_05760 [Oscillibacter sp.]|nr:hypothetical protein [Oscillibacter sp.]